MRRILDRMIFGAPSAIVAALVFFPALAVRDVLRWAAEPALLIAIAIGLYRLFA